jgi:hypothetical protein
MKAADFGITPLHFKTFAVASLRAEAAFALLNRISVIGACEGAAYFLGSSHFARGEG